MYNRSGKTVAALAGSVGIFALLSCTDTLLPISAAAKGQAQSRSQGLTEFVSGNLLFVLCHEMAHAAMTQMGLPVLGKVEDAADSFATVRMIGLGTTFSHRVLAEAAKGWFLQDRRNQKAGGKINYYDEHGIDQQRAYQIVCLMVGSNKGKFRDLASETRLPESRQDSCVDDYRTTSYSWEMLLKPHLRTSDQLPTKIDVVYGDAKGRLNGVAQAARSVRMLETVAQNVSEQFSWQAPFTIEMQSCGFPNAMWDPSALKLTLCYELAADFEDLYNAYDASAAASERWNLPKNRKKS
jgi:hypothetical protein